MFNIIKKFISRFIDTPIDAGESTTVPTDIFEDIDPTKKQKDFGLTVKLNGRLGAFEVVGVHKSINGELVYVLQHVTSNRTLNISKENLLWLFREA